MYAENAEQVFGSAFSKEYFGDHPEHSPAGAWPSREMATDPIARTAEGIDSVAVTVSWTYIYIDRVYGSRGAWKRLLWCRQPGIISTAVAVVP